MVIWSDYYVFGRRGWNVYGDTYIHFFSIFINIRSSRGRYYYNIYEKKKEKIKKKKEEESPSG